jgi:hypothetical protein
MNATLALEDFLAARSHGVKLIGIRRQLKRIQIERQSVEMFVAITVRLSQTRVQLVGAGNVFKSGAAGTNRS